jgi:hypothetical protein
MSYEEAEEEEGICLTFISSEGAEVYLDSDTCDNMGSLYICISEM